MRPNGRQPDELRPVTFTPGFMPYAEGSVLIATGNTRVICTASVEEGSPPFRHGSGWLSAQYRMLPRSTTTRVSREPGGRETEIQRLIGRALRAALDLDKLGERTIWIDCDVIQADGGTRTASITGGYVALALAIRKLREEGKLEEDPLMRQIVAVSVGIVEGIAVLDLEYEEDARAEVDLNLIMTSDGDYVDIEGTAEGQPFSGQQLDELLRLGRHGISQLAEAQRRALVG